MAEHIAGVTELFVEQMNARAKQLGMNDTHFVNCTGLPAEGACDERVGHRAHEPGADPAPPGHPALHDDLMDTLRGGSFQLSNTNKLIRFYDGATGLKTGSTGSAGYA